MKYPHYFSISALIKPAWGYSIREPNTTALQPALPLPPPTTIVGAVSYGLAKLFDIGETYRDKQGKLKSLAEEMYNASVYAGASLAGAAVIHNDINRYLMRPFARNANRSKPEYQFAAISAGKVYINGSIKLLATFDLDKINQIWPISELSSNIEKDLERAAHYITRIGSKESIVSVTSVKAGKPTMVNDKKICTSLYQSENAVSLEDVTECDGSNKKTYTFFVLKFWKTGFREIGEPELFVAPGRNEEIITSKKVGLKVNPNCLGYEFNGDGFAICQ